MKKLIALALLIGVVAYAATVPAAGKGTLTVIVENFRNSDGKVSVVLYNSEEPFPKQADKAFMKTSGPIKDKKAKVVFKDVPYGEYAFVVLHDENENKKMDYSAVGLPQEGYAFSNNATGMLGPPDYKDAKFELKGDSVEQTIKLNY